MKTLTKKQEDVLMFVMKHNKDFGFTPTLYEIRDAFNWKSHYSAFKHIELIANKGYLSKRKNGYIVILDQAFNYFLNFNK